MTNNLEKCNNIQHPGKLKSTCGNVPYVTAGNPIFGTESGVMFNDMLGTTLGIKGDDFTRTNLTAFGENLDAGDKAFFTGKPLVGELGYAFLFRNYRPEQGKWQTADPLGYPDGWNNFAYVNNELTSSFDWQGLCQEEISYYVLIDRNYHVTIGPLQVSLTVLENNAGYVYSISKNYFATLTESHPEVVVTMPCGKSYTIDAYHVSGDTDVFTEGWTEIKSTPYTDEQLQQLMSKWDSEISDNIEGIFEAWKNNAVWKEYKIKCEE